MAIVYVCDRCGYIYKCTPVVKVDGVDVNSLGYSRLFDWNLCQRCLDSFKKWFEEKEK